MGKKERYVLPHEKCPFLWLLLPLMVGIVCGDTFPHVISYPCLGTVAGIGIVLLYGCYRCGRWQQYGVLLFLWLGLVGHQVASRQWSVSDYSFTNTESIYRVQVCEAPAVKERSILCPVRVQGVFIRDSLHVDGHQPLFLFYFPKDTLAGRIRRGHQLWVHARLLPPRNNGNPEEFDYVRYLRRQGGCGTAYVPAGRWRIVGYDSVRTLRQSATDYREKVIALYRHLGFRGDRLAVLAALTVGYQDDLSEDIVETYSVAGASHVLSLSGLHIGFLYALLWALFCPVWRRWSWLKIPLLMLMVAGLWAFAFFTGLASPVIRSVIMISFLAFASLQSEKLLTMNSLAAAAFFMLLGRPLWLFDVSFQLSFLSLAAILVFQPPLSAFWRPRWCILKYIWGLVTVSVAAQIGTAPLVMLYFSRFSTHFLLSNLWVVPLSSLILYASVFLLLLTPIPVCQLGFAKFVGGLVDIQNRGLQLITELPFASFDHLWLDKWDVLLFYVFIASVCFCWRRFTPRRVYASLLSLLLLVSWHSFTAWVSRPECSVVFYNVRKMPVVHCLDNGYHSWLVGVDTLPDLNRLSRSLGRYWDRLRLFRPVLASDGYVDASLSLHDGILTYVDCRICILSDDRWKGKFSSAPLHVNYLYVCRGYQGTLKDIEQLFDVDFVVFDASFTGYYQRQMVEECVRLGIPYHTLAVDGFLRIPL